MEKLNYPVLIYPGESGKLIATCPSIVGCITQGDTLEEVLANAREVIELCLEDMRAHGEELPPPATAMVASVTVEV